MLRIATHATVSPTATVLTRVTSHPQATRANMTAAPTAMLVSVSDVDNNQFIFLTVPNDLLY
jgi:hypothetical protein